jgi:hypothetical protein
MTTEQEILLTEIMEHLLPRYGGAYHHYMAYAKEHGFDEADQHRGTDLNICLNSVAVAIIGLIELSAPKDSEHGR